MNCLVNPVAWRLGLNKVWNFLFFSKNYNYSFLNHRGRVIDYIINYYISNFFQLKLKKTFFFRITKSRVFMINEKIFIILLFKFYLRTILKLYDQKEKDNPLFMFRQLFKKHSFKKKKFLNKNNINSIKHLNLKKYEIKRLKRFLFVKLKKKLAKKKLFFKKKKVVIFKKRLKFFKALMIRNLFLVNFIFPYLIHIKKFLIKTCFNLFPSFNNFKVFFILQNKNKLNIEFLIDSVFKKLGKKKYKLKKIISNLSFLMQKLQYKLKFKGFKIKFSGRVSRRDRVTYYWKNIGAVPLNTKLAKVEFVYKTIILRNSLCILKIWTCY